MQKARAFFLVCAGLLCLALAYHFGARDAVGQSTQAVECVAWDGALFAVVNRSWIQYDTNTQTVYGSYPLPLPGRVIGVGNHSVVYENGEVYVYQGTPGAWVFSGNLTGGGPTPTQQESFGSVKSRYR